MYGGKKFVRSNKINNNIHKWKTDHSVGYFDSYITNIEKLKKKINNYDDLIDTKNHAGFQALKERINKLVQKTQPSRNRNRQQASNTKKDEFFYNIDILTPEDFINKFKNNNNKTFEFILKELSIYSSTSIPQTRNPKYENNFKYFLANIRGLCNKYKENASHENNIGNYVSKHLTNMLVITQISLIQYKINQNAFNKNARTELFDDNQFSPHELIEFRVRGQRQQGVLQHIGGNDPERDLTNLYESNNPNFSLDNMIHCAIIFKESYGMIKNVKSHFESKNNVFYKEKLLQYLEAMYNYYYYSYVYYTNLIIKCLHNFNNALSKIIQLLDTLVVGNSVEAQIIIYMIQKVMNNYLFIRNDNFDTNNYEKQFIDILSEKGTLGLLNKLFGQNRLITNFTTIIENIKSQYEDFIQNGYNLPTENISFNGDNVMVVGIQAVQNPFNGITAFNQSGATQNYLTSAKLNELGNNINESLKNAFISSVNHISNLAESYINYRNLLNEKYTYPEESRKTRSLFGKTSDYFKQKLRDAKAGIRKTRVEYTPMPFNNQEENIEENNTTNQLRNKSKELTNIVNNLDSSKTYLNQQKLPLNFIRTNNGKRVINIYDLSKSVKTNVESYRGSRNRSVSQDERKIYNIKQTNKKYKELKDKSKNQILTKKNTTKNKALIAKMKTLGVNNADLANMRDKLTDYKVVVNAVNTRNMNKKTLSERLAMLKTVKSAENNYLAKIPIGKNASTNLANIFKTQLLNKMSVLEFRSVKNNFTQAKEVYNIPANNIIEKPAKLPVGNKSIKSIKELNEASEQLKSNIENAKRYTKKTKLNKMLIMINDANNKYIQIKKQKEFFDDSLLRTKEGCLRVNNTIYAARGNNPDYEIIHINPVTASCTKKTYLYIYEKLITQIEKLYQKMFNEYKSLEQSNNITLGSLAHVKDCYTIINHNIKIITEKIFV